jgi:hypothetical protein
VHGAEGVLKTIVNGARIDQVTQAQLADAAQTLEGRMVDELKNKRMANGDKTVDRIVDYFSKKVGHGTAILFEAKISQSNKPSPFFLGFSMEVFDLEREQF